jgi:3-oxoacyl-[acyl-carrier protein] reductase
MKGQTAVITGGGRGIGKAIAETLARRGVNIVVVDVNLDIAKETADYLSTLGVRSIPARADVSKASDVSAIFQTAAKEFEKVEILVNNAGITRDGLLMRMKEEDWDAVLNINLKGTFLCTKAALKGMVERRYGKIISLSSMDYIRSPTPGHLHYGSSKAAIAGFTKALAREVGNHGINVNAVAPGIIETEMTREILKRLRGQFLEQIALGRTGTPEDVAKTVVFLASDDSAYISGQTINVNGGILGGMA